MLDFKEIKEKYPKSYKLLVAWTKDTLLSFQSMLMAGVKDATMPEISDEMAEKALDGFIKVNYRLLFDFFDKNDAKISISYKQGFFLYRINDQALGGSNANRMEMENDAFQMAFNYLEKRLT